MIFIFSFYQNLQFIGVRASVMFHFMCVHIILSLVCGHLLGNNC